MRNFADDDEPDALARITRLTDLGPARPQPLPIGPIRGAVPASEVVPFKWHRAPVEHPRVRTSADGTGAGLSRRAADEIRAELRRMLLLNRSTFPLGTLACVVVLAALAHPYLPPTALFAWTVAGVACSLLFGFALYPPLVNRAGRDGMPLLIGPGGYLCGVVFAAAPWLDLDALRASPWHWICLIMLFAVSSGTQSGTVMGTPHLLRVLVPTWVSTSLAYAVIGAWVVAVAAVIYLLIVVRDHISTRKLVIAGVEARVAAHHAALTDPLTGLANRAAALAELQRLAADAADDAPQNVVLLYVDLDRFKQVNDTHGHLVGDALLVEASQRLVACSRPEDLVARLGGDEFLVVVAAPAGSAPDTRELSTRIIVSLERAFRIGGRDLFVSASVGVASTPDVALDPDDVIGRADRALYSAKRSGRRRAVHYTPDLAVSAGVPAPVPARD